MLSIRIFIAFTFLPTILVAQKTTTLTVDEILNLVVNENGLIASQQKRLESYQYVAQAATAWMAPMIGAGTYMTPYPGQMLMNPSDKGSLMFQLEQDIPIFGRLEAQKKYVLSQASVEKSAIEINKNELKSQVRKLIAGWKIAKQKITLLNQNEKVLKTLQKIEQIRYPFNQSDLTKQYQTELKINELNNQKLTLKAEIIRARSWINSLMNKPFDYSFEVDSSYTPHFIPSTLSPEMLMKSKADLHKMDREIEAMKLKLDINQRQLKPSFKLRIDHASPLSSGMPKSFSLMGMLSLPIAPWSAKMYKSEAKAMQIEIDAAQLQKQAMVREAQGALYGMQEQIKKMQEQIGIMKNSVIPILKKQLDLSLINYRENKTEITSVLMTWEALQMMEINLMDENLKLYLMIADYDKELFR